MNKVSNYRVNITDWKTNCKIPLVSLEKIREIYPEIISITELKNLDINEDNMLYFTLRWVNYILPISTLWYESYAQCLRLCFANKSAKLLKWPKS